MKIFFKSFVPILLLSVGLFFFWLLNAHSPKPAVRSYLNNVPPVSVQEVFPQVVNIPVYSRGLVTPGVELVLTSELGGRVSYVSAGLIAGGRFRKGDLLFAVDDSAIKHDITRVESRLLTAQQRYRTLVAEIEAEQGVEGLKTSQSYLNKRLQESKAQVRAARAEYELVQLKFKKTKVFAPFDGRVRESFLVEEQIVPPGFRAAIIYATNSVQVRLPLSDRQIQLINMPGLTHDLKKNPKVMLRLQFGENFYYWSGSLIGAEGSVDPRNRLMYMVAQIDTQNQVQNDQANSQVSRPTLWSGQLLEAEISGKTFNNIVVLPREILRFGNHVWVVDENDRLREKNVKVLYKAKNLAYVNEGLAYGERVVVSPLDVAIEGMKVKTQLDGQAEATVSNPNSASSIMTRDASGKVVIGKSIRQRPTGLAQAVQYDSDTKTPSIPHPGASNVLRESVR